MRRRKASHLHMRKKRHFCNFNVQKSHSWQLGETFLVGRNRLFHPVGWVPWHPLYSDCEDELLRFYSPWQSDFVGPLRFDRLRPK